MNLAANLSLDLGLAGPGTVVAVYAADSADPGAAGPGLHERQRGAPLRAPLRGAGRPTSSAACGRSARRSTAGALSELPVHRFPLEECAAAQDAVQGGATGKVLLDVG